MTIIDIPQSISIVLAAPVPDVLTSCSLVPPTPPPAPPTSGIIYTPVAPGITYAALPTVTIVDTSPDQIIGCIHDTADNPQGRLNVLFPSAINGDGVIERRNNDIWVYNGTIWNNVGPSPGPTIQTVPTLILPYNETAIYEGRLRLGNVITKFEYALEVLTTVPALVLQTTVDVRRIRKVEVPAAGTITLAAQTPAVSTTIVIAPPATGVSIAAPLPVVVSGASIAVPVLALSIDTLSPVSAGHLKTQVFIPSADTTLTVSAPSISTGASVPVPASNTTLAGLTPSNVGYFDADFSSVSLLLHMDGSNNSTTFTDSSNNVFTVTAAGDAKISTAQSKFGGASALFDGSGDYLDVGANSAFSFGTGDFTVEFWYRCSTAPVTAFRRILAHPSSTNAANTFQIWHAATTASGATVDAVELAAPTGTSIVASVKTAVSDSTWHHIAFSRQSGTTRAFLDGVLKDTATDNNNYTRGGTEGVRISSRGDLATNTFINGYVDELRITKGVARYTAAFTVSSQAFPNK